MNYVIFKGKNSNDFKSLIISELPPISKPKVRAEIVTIDGVDGDIVNQVGYSSYNKSIKIGLRAGYMLSFNEIIKYFSGNGTLVCSNEPDKYYNAEIIEQVDYERLIKFRQAIVKFHVQPYKYLLEENVVEENISNQREVTVINQGLEMSLPIITLYGRGTIILAVNGLDVFKYTFDEDENDFVTINSLEQEAYKNKILKNRNMLGDFPTLESGKNIITWSGNLIKIIIEPKSRWL